MRNIKDKYLKIILSLILSITMILQSFTSLAQIVTYNDRTKTFSDSFISEEENVENNEISDSESVKLKSNSDESMLGNLLRAVVERNAGDSWEFSPPTITETNKADFKINSVTENADGTLSWNVTFIPSAAYFNGAYHQFSQIGGDKVQSISDMVDKTGGVFRTSIATPNNASRIYTIVTSKPSRETASLKGTISIVSKTGQTVTVQRRASISFTATAKKPIQNGKLTVNITNTDNVDLSGASIHLTGPENKDLNFNQATQTIELKAGKYEVSTSGIPTGYSVSVAQSATVEADKETTLPITITKDVGTVNLTITGEKPAAFRILANNTELKEGNNTLSVGEYTFTVDGFDSEVYKATIDPTNGTLFKDENLALTVNFEKIIPTFYYTVNAMYPEGEAEPQDLKAILTDSTGKRYEAKFLNGAAKFSKIPKGNYTLTTDNLPLTWENTEPKVVTVDENSLSTEIIFAKKTVDKGKVLITGKIQTKDGLPITNKAEFILKNSAGITVKENGIDLILSTDSEGKIYREVDRKVLSNGEYKLWLKTVPSGYRDPGKATNTLNINTENNLYDFTAILEVAGIKFDIKVTDSKKNPVEGAVLKIRKRGSKSFVQKDGKDVEMKTDANGYATVILSGLEAGEYELVHQGTKGFKTYPPIPFKVDSTTTIIKSELGLQRNEESRIQWDIYLKDEVGNPIANKILKFYDQAGKPVMSNGTPLEITTNDSGEYKGGTFIDIYPGTYTVKFEGDKDYSSAEKTVTIGEGTGRVITELRTKLLGEQGNITVNVINAESGKPVSGAPFHIYKIEGNKKILLDQGVTDVTGKRTTKPIPYGDYEVLLVTSGNLTLDNLDDPNPQKTIISSEKRQQQIDFKVNRKLISMSNAGSLKIEGAWVDNPKNLSDNGDVLWTATATKNASSPSLANRGIKIRFELPVSEMGQPKKPIVSVTRKIGDKTTIENIEAKGMWIKEGDKWVYTEDRSGEKNPYEEVYRYEFNATPIESSPKYSITGKMEIISDNPFEIIPSATGTKTLTRKSGAAKAAFGGSGIADNVEEIVRWDITDPSLQYNETTPGPNPIPENALVNENSVPGKFTYIISLPEGSGQKLLDGTELLESNFFRAYDPNDPINENKVPLNLKWEKKFDPDKKAWIVTVDRTEAGQFRPEFKITTKINREESVDQFRIKIDTEFKSQDLKLNFDSAILTAPNLPPLSGKLDEKRIICKEGGGGGQHKITLYGKMTEDQKNIIWTARLTNIDPGSYIDFKSTAHPSILQIDIGEGLGDAKILQVNSLGKTFPYIWDGKANVFEDKSAGKKFEVHADYVEKQHFMNGVGTKNVVGSPNVYRYVDTYKKPKYNVGFAPGHNWKTDTAGILYNWDPVSGASSEWRYSSGPNFQALAPGEFMEVNFITPITDFSRIQTEGYNIVAKSKIFTHNQKDFTDIATPICGDQEGFKLQIKPEPHDLSSSEVVLHKDGIGEVRGNGKYINSGKDIEWNLSIKPLVAEVADLTSTRKIKVIYQLVDDSDQTGENPTGLGIIQNPIEDKYSVGSMKSSNSIDPNGYGGTILTSNMRANEEYKLTFTTPVLADKPDYRLKIVGFYYDNDWLGREQEHKLQNGTRPQDTENDNIAYVILEGKAIKINATKLWENLYDNQPIPNINLTLSRVDAAGNRETLFTKTVATQQGQTQNNITFEKYPNGHPKAGETLERFDPNGYLYRYYLEEQKVEGFKSYTERLNPNGEYWLIKNVADDFSVNEKDPIKYEIRPDGKYPAPFIQDGPDIRNADTTGISPITEKKYNDWAHMDSSGHNYKSEYTDSIIGKWGEQTTVPGQFNMNLTIEGKGKTASSDMDIVFVIDTSNSMRYKWNAADINDPEKNTKMAAASKSVHKMVETIKNMPGNNRVGIVNFATVVEKLKDKKQIPEAQRDDYELQYKDYVGLNYVKNDVGYNEILSAIPGEKGARYASRLDYYLNDGRHNIGLRHDGMTNIADGFRKGTQILYPDDNASNRKKILVMISDGAPVAHLKLKHFPLDTSKTFEENLVPTGVFGRDTEMGKYIICNNTFGIYGDLRYYTEEGIQITDHLTPTVAVTNYFKTLHKDMEVFSVAISADSSGYIGHTNVEGAKDQSNEMQYMEQLLRAITTDPEKNYYKADSEQALIEYITEFKTKLPQSSIINGTVEDPMGEMIILDKKHGFKVASDATLTDGDFYISDNYFNYLGQDGKIHNNNPSGNTIDITVNQYYRNTYGSAIKNGENLKVSLDTYGQPLQYYNTNTGQLEENAISKPAPDGALGMYRYVLAINNRKDGPESTKLPYNEGSLGFQLVKSLEEALAHKDKGDLILIKNKHKDKFLTQLGFGEYPKISAQKVDKNLLSMPDDPKTPRIKVNDLGDKIRITGLYLTTGEKIHLRYRTHIKTEAQNFAGNYYYPMNGRTTLEPRPKESPGILRDFPIPSAKAPTLPFNLDKFWIDKEGNTVDITKIRQDLLKEGRTSINVSINQYKAKVNENGEFIDSNGEAISEGYPVKDESTLKTIRNIELNEINGWHFDTKDLLAYDNKGRPFIYDIIEENPPEGYIPKAYQYIPKYSYIIDMTHENHGYKLLDKGRIALENSLKPGDSYKVETTYKSGNTDSTTKMMSYNETSNVIEWNSQANEVANEIKVKIIRKIDGEKTKVENFNFKPKEEPSTLFSLNNIAEDNPKGQFKIQKVDEANDKKLLEEAKFILTSIEDETKKITKSTDKSGLAQWMNLEKGEYILEEIKAPVGYELNSDPIKVKVGPETEELMINGKKVVRFVIEFIGADGKKIVPIENKDSSNEKTVPIYKITNKEVIIPYTGGNGPQNIFTIIGLSLISICAYIYIKRYGGDAYR